VFAKKSETYNISNDHSNSFSIPFFRPSTPLPLTVTETIHTPNMTHILHTKKRQLLLRRSKANKGKGKNGNHTNAMTTNTNATNDVDMPERKSTIIGAASNLTVNIISAGIVGIPYAMKQTGIILFGRSP